MMTGARVLGVPVKTLRAIACETGRSHALAEALWASGIHEARILASIVAEPKRVNRDQLKRWVLDLDLWDLCDQCCTNLWVRTPMVRASAASNHPSLGARPRSVTATGPLGRL